VSYGDGDTPSTPDQPGLRWRPAMPSQPVPTLVAALPGDLEGTVALHVHDVTGGTVHYLGPEVADQLAAQLTAAAEEARNPAPKLDLPPGAGRLLRPE
jgi:hypothetical protein